MVPEYHQSYHTSLVATQISCWPSGFFDTIKRKCVSYHQNMLFRNEYQFNPDDLLLHYKVDRDFKILESSNKEIEIKQLKSSLLVKHLNIFKEVGNASAKIL